MPSDVVGLVLFAAPLRGDSHHDENEPTADAGPWHPAMSFGCRLYCGFLRLGARSVLSQPISSNNSNNSNTAEAV
jgi:hypothetical protein